MSTSPAAPCRRRWRPELWSNRGWTVGATPRVGTFAFDTPSPRIGAFTSSFSASTPQFRTFAASIGTTVGNDVDFIETAPVRRVDYNAALDLRPSDRLRVSATYTSTSFARRSTGERSAFARIPRVKAEYQLARPLFVRVVSQYTATRREANVSNSLRNDVLVSYRPAPGTVFFAGYGGSLSEDDPLAFTRLRRTADAFFVKGSYVLRTL